MAGIRDHRDLHCWQLSDRLEDGVAEGFSRYYPKENAPFVRMAKSSLSETIAHLDRARKKQLITKDECDQLTSLARRARGAATQYLIYLESAPPPPPGRRRQKPSSEAATPKESTPKEPAP